jgi:hypothetical protein
MSDIEKEKPDTENEEAPEDTEKNVEEDIEENEGDDQEDPILALKEEIAEAAVARLKSSRG